MFGSTVLDVAIGLALVYLVLALVCSTVMESVAGIFHMRSSMLKKAVAELLDGKEGAVTKKFFAHPLIRSLSKDGAPSYIPPDLFARTLLDIASPQPTGRALTTDEALKGFESLQASDLQQTLRAVLSGAASSLEIAEDHIASWFEASMERVSGWYKRKSQAIIFVVAVLVTFFANADTLQVVNRLWSEPELRAQVVQQAQQASQAASPEEANLLVEYKDGDNPVPSTPVSIKNIPAAVNGPVAQLLGWKAAEDADLLNKGQYGTLLSAHLAGWILTAFAVSLGAPFWFDTLKRFINIRNAGTNPQEKKAKAQAQAASANAAGAGGRP